MIWNVHGARTKGVGGIGMKVMDLLTFLLIMALEDANRRKPGKQVRVIGGNGGSRVQRGKDCMIVGSGRIQNCIIRVIKCPLRNPMGLQCDQPIWEGKRDDNRIKKETKN